jgi:magnesium-protoporphyrin IX monomethyl ester (oxidative) cyclase
LSVPDIVHLTVLTPYPGTEIWHTESRRLTTLDYRLFDIQHAVVPTTLPLEDFYRELVLTQAVIARKHLGRRAMVGAARVLAGNLARGQTNFARMIWQFNRVYNPSRQIADHNRPVRYELPLPSQPAGGSGRQRLYLHTRVPTHEHTASGSSGGLR